GSSESSPKKRPIGVRTAERMTVSVIASLDGSDRSHTTYRSYTTYCYSSRMSNALLQTINLTKHYGGARAALIDLNLAIAPGEIFGLLGPNGSGKSTALRMLLGFMKPTSGSASIAGLDCWSDSVEVRRRVAYLPGELRLYETMTGRQLLRFLSELRRGELA